MIPSALVLLVAANGGNASAQNSIVSDGTLSTPTVVTRVDASGTTTYNITGGTLRSNNQVLFHSFSAFGLRQHEIGSFLNGNTVQTIFSRVTGGSPSLIDGLIKANGSANLYLINPQGIIFGPTGAIQVGGSFVATTAQELRFGNEKFLAGVGATGDAPLITANITPGLQFGSGGAQLKVAGTLEVLPGNTIRLAAGPNDSVEVSGALQAPAGSIQIDGGAPITISGTLLNVNNGPGSGGSISLQGSTVTLQDGGKVISRSTDGGSGAAISVDTGTLNLLGGSQLISESSGGGAGGSIQLNSSNPQDLAITFSGDSLISTSTSKTAAGGGKGGDISIGSSGKTLTMSGPGVVIAETRGSGEGGKLDLQGSMVSLDRVLATTQTSGSGKGGQINLSANSFILNNATTVSALTKSAGEGGSIAVDANSLSLNFSQLRSEAHSTGQGGTINLFTSKTPDLTISFGHFLSNIASQTTQTASSGGEGGDITIGSSGKTLTITGLGSIAVETYGSGGGGVLNLKGSTISLDQTFASTQASGSGNGGQINFSADSITLSDGAAALALTSSSGAGGLIAVDTGSLSFSGKSRLTAEARGSGAGGGITIAPSSVDALRVSGPGTIETGTTSSATAGTIRIGSSSTTSTTVDNGVQIKASGPNARVDLLSSGTTTFQGDSSVEATGGLITVSGSTKATISGGSLNATNNGAITVQGGDIAVGSATGRTLLLAGKGALAVDGSESETKAPNLTLLDSSISLNAGAGKSIEVFSGTTVTPGSTTLRAVGADGTNVADAKAVRLTSSGVSGSISVGGRSSAPATPVTTTTIGDGVAITATDGSLNFTTRGNFALGVGSQLAAKSIKIKATSTDPITTPLLDKIAGSSSWLINQDAVINAIGYMPTPDRSLSVEAAGIKVGNFSLNPAKASWEMVSGTALDLLASGAHGLDLQNLNLSFSRTGAAGTADLFRAKSSAGNTSIGSTSTIHANGDGFAVSSSETTTIAGTLSTTNTGTRSGGSISLEGASVVLTGNGKVNTSGSGDGAAITVKTGLLDLAAGSQLSTESSGSGTSGSITVAPSSAAAFTVNGPGLIQSLASGNGKAGAIRIGSSSTTDTTVDKGVQIKATGTGAAVDLLSSGTTSFQSGGSIEATGGAIKLDGVNTTIKGGSLTANQGGSITVNGSSNAEVSGGLLQADGGTISISGVNSTALGNTSLIANSVNSGGALKKGQIVVGGSLSGSPAPASATAHSNTTTLASGARLSANGGGRIDVLSTGRTSSNGNLEASGGVINLAGDTSTISGGSLTADQGGSISVNGSTKASISGGSLSSTNSGSSSSGGSITLEGATVSLTGTGKVNTTTSGSGAGAAIMVKTGTLDLAAGTELSTNSTSDGISGAITVAPSSAAALTVNGPGLIQSQASVNGAAGAISIGSSTTTATTAGNGVQIKASGSSAKVDLLSSGTTTFQGGGSIEATGGAIKLDGANTTISGGSLTANQGGSITVNGSTNAEVSGGSLQADGGTLTISAANSTTLGNASLIANSVNSGGALKKGQIVVGGSLSGSPASAIANSNTTTLASGAKLSANGGGRIDVLSTGHTSSTGNLEASGGVINLAGDTSTISGGSLTADQGGSITVNGSTKASISGGSLSSTNSGTTSGGAISLEGATVSLTGTGKVNTTTSGSGAGAAITVKTGTLDLASGTELSTKSSDSGTSGAITVTPSSAAALTVNGPGLIQSQASGNGKAGAISIGSSTTTTATTAGNGVQIKASGSSAKVELLSSGTTTFRGDSSIEATGGAIKLDGADTTISGGSLTANQGGSITVNGSGNAEVSGGSLTADQGGSIFVIGPTNVVISSTSFSALNSSTKNGEVSVQGGNINVGGESGRTILLAGNGAVGADEVMEKAPNFTLLDGGTSSSITGITLKGPENKAIQIFSGSPASAEPQGLTYLRGTTSIEVIKTQSGSSGSILIGGFKANDVQRAASAEVMLTDSVSLSAPNISTVSRGKIVDSSIKKNSNKTEIAAPYLELNRQSLSQVQSRNNLYVFKAVGDGTNTGYIKLAFDTIDDRYTAELKDGKAAKMTFEAVRKIEFNNVKIDIEKTEDSGAGSFSIKSTKGDIILNNSHLNATGRAGSIEIVTNNGGITLSNSSLNTSLDGNNIQADTNAGLIRLKADGSAHAINISNSKINSATSTDGTGGAIFLIGNTINLTKAVATSQTSGSGRGGSINIHSDQIKLLNMSQLNTSSAILDSQGLHNYTKQANTGQAGVIKLSELAPGKPESRLTLRGASVITSATSSKVPYFKDEDLGSISLNFSKVELFNGSKIDTQTWGAAGGGLINLTAQKVQSDGNSIATSQTRGSGRGGSITINSPVLELKNGAQLTVATSSEGVAGDIKIYNDNPASRSTSISFVYDKKPTSDTDKSVINAQTTYSGNGGSIFLGSSGQTLTISGAGTITAETKGSGKGGDINLSGTMISIKDGSEVTAKTTASGLGGVIRVNADSLALSGAKTRLDTKAAAGSSGDAGQIFLNALDPKVDQAYKAFFSFSPRNLSIIFSDLAKINAETEASGKGGSIFLGSSGQTLTISGAGTITAETKGSGKGGDINLSGTMISIKDGSEVTAKTTASGLGGTIRVNANSLALTGASTQLDTLATSTGNAGKIFLNSQDPDFDPKYLQSFAYTPRDLTILLSTKANINASTSYQDNFDLGKIDQQAKGGSIFLGSSGQTLSIAGAGTITAETKGSGKGADINLSGTKISIDGGASLTAKTTKTGEGGTIRVNADSLALTGASTQLDTLATSTGNAGRIFLNSQDPDFDPKYLQSFAYTPRDLTILLSTKANINASTSYQDNLDLGKIDQQAKGGSIFLGSSGQTLSISGAGTITAETKGSGKGGDINLSGTKISIKGDPLQGDLKVTATTRASGLGGVIRVNADSLDLSGAKTQLSTLADKGSSGDAGLIFLKANSINLNQSSITAETRSRGLGGHISVDTSSLNLYNGSNLTTQAFNIGKAGEILLNRDVGNPRSLAINFTGSSTINASTSQQAPGGGKGGDILIATGSTPSVSISGAGSITAETKGSGKGGVLDLKAATITLSNGAKATTETSGTGNAGAISLIASTINMDTGSRVDAKAGKTLDATEIKDSSENHYTILPNNGVTGDGGLISLLANSITLDKASSITAETQTTGIGGQLYVDTSSLNLYNGSNLTTQAFNIGKAGEILLNATNPRNLAITFTGSSTINASTSQQAPGGGKGGSIVIGTASTPSLVVSGPGSITAETEGWGAGGSLDLNANSISFNNGSIATTQTTGSGRGGSVQVQGNTIVLDGQSRITAQSGLYQGNEPGVSTPTGPAGSITITASGPNSLHLYNGSSITVATNSSTAFRDPSDLGDISIRTPYLDMKGGSLISAKTDGAAQGGTISLEASRVDLDGGSRIRVDGPRKERSTASGTGQAGNINLIISNNLSLTNLSGINASTTASNSPNSGANIIIWVGGDLLLSGNSSITAAAYGLAKGGNILLRLPNGFLRAAFPVRGGGNDILATAEYGSGGLIDVSALGVIGFNFTSSGLPQPISQLSTRAASGRNGVTAIYTPNLDPDRGVVPIEQPIDPSSGLDQSCSPRAEKSSFQTCGRGGVPALPGDSPGRRPPLDDLGAPPVAPLFQPAAARSSTLR